NTDPSADTSACDDPIDDIRTLAGAVARFREGEAVCVICNTDGAVSDPANIDVERVADQLRRVGILHQLGNRTDRSWYCKSEGRWRLQFALCVKHEPRDGSYRILVA